MYSSVFVFVGVVVQFLVAESKQGHYDNVSMVATWFMDSNSTIKRVARFGTIYSSDNLTGNLPLDRIMDQVYPEFSEKLPVLYENSFSGLRTRSLDLADHNINEIKPYAFNNSVVHTLDLSYNSLRKIRRHAFFNSSVSYLDLVRNRIEYIEPRAFEGMVLHSQADYPNWQSYVSRMEHYLPNLGIIYYRGFDTVIDLKLNKLETIQAGVFNNVNVVKIDLSLNKIRVLESDAFQAGVFSNVNVEKIDLSLNNIGVLEPDAFTHTNAVKWLSLERNEIVNITKNVFQSENLAVLRLDYNRIEFIEPHSFSRLPRIENISMGNNNLNGINRGIFCNLSVKILDLQWNHIEYIERQAFANLPNLVYLNLRKNQLTSLKESIFSNIPKMKYTILGYDTEISTNLEIRVLEPDAFQAGVFNNVNVEKIDLSFNIIGVLEPNAFPHINTVKWLSLERNGIVNITKNVFQSENLAVLRLDYNAIEFIEPNSFSRLPRIETISLRNNNLNGIKRGIFCNLSVKILDLQWNSIRYIEQQAFADLPNLVYLNLKYNRLTSLKDNMFSNIPKMRYIVLDYNIDTSTNLERYHQNEGLDSSILDTLVE